MLNWDLYQDSFSKASVRKLWSQRAMLEAWIKVEQTLAICQADQGLIPQESALRISQLKADDIDQSKLLDSMQLVGRPIVGLIAQIRAIVGEQHAPFVHYLSTTQDIMDTACMLQIQLSVTELQVQLDALIARIEQLSVEQQGVQMMGRTNAQHAIPIKLSTKLDVWLSELKRRRDLLLYTASHGLMVQVGGPVGDLSNYPKESGVCVKKAMAEKLNMTYAEPHWQNARDGIADIISSLGALSGSLCKIAQNINLLASSDIAEVSEGYRPGRGASSSMAHKKNQRASEFAEATARLARQRAEQIGELTLQQHERSGAAMIPEWLVVPEVFLLCSGALMWSEQLFTGLEINTPQMERRVEQHLSSL